MARSQEKSFWSQLGRRGPICTQHRSNVSIREMALWHPNSVYQSLIDAADWISHLRISPMAKRLTRLRGRQFRLAVEDILAPAHGTKHEHGR